MTVVLDAGVNTRTAILSCIAVTVLRRWYGNTNEDVGDEQNGLWARWMTMSESPNIPQKTRCTKTECVVATQVEKTFTTVEQLVETVESNQKLTEYDGVGPKTARAIEDWWENRFSREENVANSSFEETGKRRPLFTFKIHGIMQLR